MPLFKRLKDYLSPSRIRETEPAMAYDIWAAGYDHQPMNLVLALDEELFSALLHEYDTVFPAILDIGCGTGRHWEKLKALKPSRLAGYDVSQGMLSRLAEKFPGSEIHLLENMSLPEEKNESADLLVSTLALAHMKDLKTALGAWARILRSGGELILTDFHPASLLQGGQRTFSDRGKTIAIRNYIHPLPELVKTCGQLGFTQLRFLERKIDASVKEFYEKQNALNIYEKFVDTPLIYGMRFKKK